MGHCCGKKKKTVVVLHSLTQASTTQPTHGPADHKYNKNTADDQQHPRRTVTKHIYKGMHKERSPASNYCSMFTNGVRTSPESASTRPRATKVYKLIFSVHPTKSTVKVCEGGLERRPPAQSRPAKTSQKADREPPTTTKRGHKKKKNFPNRRPKKNYSLSPHSGEPGLHTTTPAALALCPPSISTRPLFYRASSTTLTPAIK